MTPEERFKLLHMNQPRHVPITDEHIRRVLMPRDHQGPPGTIEMYNSRTGASEYRWPGDTYNYATNSWSLPDPSTTTGVGLRPIPMERSYGLTAYELVVAEKDLIENPDIQVFRDYDHAKKRLIAGARAPAGCTRVFEAAHVPESVRRSLPGLLSYRKDLLFVTDQPALVMSDPALALASCRTFNHIPCSLSAREIGDILAAEPSLRLLEKSTMFGLPTLGLKKLTKLGKPPRSPQQAINERKRNFYLTHSVLHLDLHRAFVNTLLDAFKVQTGDPTLDSEADARPRNEATRIRLLARSASAPRHVSIQTQAASTRDIHLDLAYLTSCSLYRDPRVKRTWSDIAGESAGWAASVAELLDEILATDAHLRGRRSYYGRSGRKYEPLWWEVGVLRTPFTFLRAHRRQVVLEALSLYTSHLSRFTEYPSPCDKIHTAVREVNAASLKKLHTNLYKLARSMGCRSYPALPTAHIYKGPTHEQ